MKGKVRACEGVRGRERAREGEKGQLQGGYFQSWLRGRNDEWQERQHHEDARQGHHEGSPTSGANGQAFRSGIVAMIERMIGKEVE